MSAEKTIRMVDLLIRIERACEIAAEMSDPKERLHVFIGALWGGFVSIDPDLGTAFAKAAGVEHVLNMGREA